MAARFSSILHDVAAVSVECYPAPSRRYQKAGRFARATCPAASPEVFASSTTAALAFARVFSGAAQTVSSRRSPFPIQGLLEPNLTPLYQGARFKSLGLDGRVGFGALMSRCVARVFSAAAHTVSSLGLLFILVAVGPRLSFARRRFLFVELACGSRADDSAKLQLRAPGSPAGH